MLTKRRWTDNGALGSDGDTAPLLAAQAHGLLESGVPIRYIQLDPWALDNAVWGAREEYFPHGLAAFRESSGGLPLLLYGSFWAGKSHGVNSTASKFGLPFVESVPFPYHRTAADPHRNEQFSEPAASSAAEFYRKIFAKHELIGYENDFMVWDFIATPAFVSEPGALAGWEGLAKGMDSAAQEKNISLQYCMALPNQLMQTLELPAVTNARASDDNTPRNGHRWGIGYTALFFNELRVAPFMDNVWSVAAQSCGGDAGHCYSRNRTCAGVALDLAVSALSSGPVGLGDGPGFTNATLVKQLCAADGTLLHLAQPATPIDRMFLKLEMPNSGNGVNGVPEIWTGPSVALGNAPHALSLRSDRGSGDSEAAGPIDFAAARFWSVMVVDAPGPAGAKLFRSDLFDEAPASALPLMVSELGSAACSNGSATAGCARSLGGKPTDSVSLQSKNPPGCATPAAKEDHSYAIYTASPSCKSLVLLGEVGKYVAVSVNRMTAVTCTDNGLDIELQPLDDAAASPVRTELQPTEETIMLAVAGLGGGGVVTHFETTVKTGVPTKVACHAGHATPICTSAADITTRA